uniref:Nicotinamide riboside kinase 1 n=1 Tax=Parasteatoda tepidariorum TaxID=114398 RepID=A0A2L2YLT5_PARTP
MENRWICVGISGCTNGGKSTLANSLLSFFPGSVVVNQDTFFRSDDSPEHVVIPELNHKNWERLESVNWEPMIEQLEEILASPIPSAHSLLIVEGHIIFNHPKLRGIFNKKYFLTLNKDECLKRRVTRVYDPPDIPGYFELCVWPMYFTNLEDVKKHCPDVYYLDGTKKREVIFDSVVQDLKSYLKKNF